MKDVLGAEPQPDPSLTREALSRANGWRHTAPSRQAGATSPTRMPRRWRSCIGLPTGSASSPATKAPPPSSCHRRGRAQGGYWPPLVGHDALNVAAERPGELTQVPDQNVQGTVQGFIRAENVAQNGWPDPMAAADQFRYAIEHERPTERRQLEMLLAGVVTGRLTLRDVATREEPAPAVARSPRERVSQDPTAGTGAGRRRPRAP